MAWCLLISQNKIFEREFSLHNLLTFQLILSQIVVFSFRKFILLVLRLSPLQERWCKTFSTSPTMASLEKSRKKKNASAIFSEHKSLLKPSNNSSSFFRSQNMMLLIKKKRRNHLFIHAIAWAEMDFQISFSFYASSSSGALEINLWNSRFSSHCSRSNRERLSRMMMHWNSFKWKVNGQSNFCTFSTETASLVRVEIYYEVNHERKLQKPLQLVSESVSCLSNVYMFPSIILSTLEHFNRAAR